MSIFLFCFSDINECAINSKDNPKACQCAPDIKNCHKDKIAQCHNSEGSFQCACSHGYRLARDNMCVDRNECFEDDQLCPQKCENTIGSYKCTCFPGFKWDVVSKTCKRKHFFSLF